MPAEESKVAPGGQGADELKRTIGGAGDEVGGRGAEGEAGRRPGDGGKGAKVVRRCWRALHPEGAHGIIGAAKDAEASGSRDTARGPWEGGMDERLPELRVVLLALRSR